MLVMGNMVGKAVPCLPVLSSLSPNDLTCQGGNEKPRLSAGLSWRGDWAPTRSALADQVAPRPTSGSISHAPGPVKDVCDQIGPVRIIDTFRRFSASPLALNKIGVLLGSWSDSKAVAHGEGENRPHFFLWLPVKYAGQMEYVS